MIVEVFMNKIITFIVPIYKIDERYLRVCIESLINQQKKNYRIILVDDGSPDNCGKICDEYLEREESISVIHQINQGVSIARNNAINMTETEWTIFIDADDWVDKNYSDEIERLILSFKNTRPDIILLDYYKEFRNKQKRISMQIESGFICEKNYLEIQKAAFYKLFQNGTESQYEVVNLWNKVYRTSFLKDNNLCFIKEARKGQDQIFNAEALNVTNQLYYQKSVFYHYRCLQKSRTNRYDPSIIVLTKIEIDALKDIISRHGLEDKCSSSLNNRICTKVYACLRLAIFNPENKDRYREKKRKALELISNDPFYSALKNVHLSDLSKSEGLFVYFLKKRWIFPLYLMVTNKDSIFRRKLN